MSSSSREDSPDWLRSFQAPTHSTLTLSSDSYSSPNHSPSHDLPIPNAKKKTRQGDRGNEQLANEGTSEKLVEPNAVKRSVWTLSSDSESRPDNSPRKEDAVLVGSSGVSLPKVLKKKSPKKRLTVEGAHTPKGKKNIDENVQRKGMKVSWGDKSIVVFEGGNHGDVEVAEEGASEKHIGGSHVSIARLPLILPEKVHRSKALVECEGDSIDLSGDMGAVGRIVVPDTPFGNSEMYLDLKGTIYKTTIVPSRTFCVVSFGQSEAKIEAIMNDFIQLKPQSNVYEAETMVEGTLEGFSFDSEDEAHKIPKATDQNTGDEEQTNGKTKGKVDKSSGVVRKKGKSAGGKLQPTKKLRKKTQGSKKGKTKK